jgi:hypothetical protein
MRFCLFVIVFCCLISLRRVVFFSTVLVRIFPFLFYFCSVLRFLRDILMAEKPTNSNLLLFYFLIFFFLSAFSVVVKRSKVFYPFQDNRIQRYLPPIHFLLFSPSNTVSLGFKITESIAENHKPFSPLVHSFHLFFRYYLLLNRILLLFLL